MSVKLSIVTVNFNNKIGLQKTVDSVKAQTWKNFEFIIIDGGSTDGVESVLVKEQANITYSISETDTGVYNAMNKGISKATGDYILFLNSGDSFYENSTLEKAIPHLDKNIDIYYGDAAYIEKNGEQIRTYPNKLTFSYFVEHNLSHQASFIKRTLFDDFFYYNEEYKIVSDWAFFIYTICKANVSYQHIDQVICNYDTEGISSVIDNHKLMHAERAKTMEKYFPLFIEDYKNIKVLNSKRTKQFLAISKNKIAFKILKGLMSTLSLFTKKEAQ
ncbi:glycosyltransferase family 2 protein [Pedobacter aquatilis]|uniref:glycosyltransferase family 2 protein n=1 Tax=Pedobacter aquatilis TaxID=351343 RepID=UPI0025B3FA89|nr:glycosyltransferase family 2 protein [Pedobacter aquatilis]MDN3587418.1 glycosyltransferase family 2 protein [Pedobacter aquatilis]